jgi:CubicO group peptidase (beta-lactamase class C family)
VISALIALLYATAAASLPSLTESHVPGVAVAVVEHGHVAVHNYGIADVETQRPVTGRTVFEAASIGKVVFAYAVLRLADEHHFDLDRPVQSYLAAPYGADPRMAKITARMVLTHRSGLPNWRGAGKELALTFEPGARFSYSGEGFLFLQKAVEAAAGEPVEAFMQRTVFRPLGMTHSSYIWLPEYDAEKAWGHDKNGARWRRRKPEGANVAATLHTTAGDLGRFVAALMRRHEFTPQTPVSRDCSSCAAESPETPHEHISWGLGVGLLRRGERTFFWHWGDDGDFKAYLFGEPRTQRAVVILTNGANGLAIAGDIAADALGLRDASAAHEPLQWLGYETAR